VITDDAAQPSVQRELYTRHLTAGVDVSGGRRHGRGRQPSKPWQSSGAPRTSAPTKGIVSSRGWFCGPRRPWTDAPSPNESLHAGRRRGQRDRPRKRTANGRAGWARLYLDPERL